ncbi:conserved hypothetical protein [Methanocaldococcus infernus ME]|uniref:Uncharacterized protein n=1 Tax=Methanocaldococcus infernus (strain DSM 11812 / JCM 15783 / ME) TaxID=573063 RepID=D5VSD9_METIM|nr:hypothetical protein [Methanocaldococcus infernus]ADG13492.1 conserved hypothetical protein [Methanocaldococcus infernus ME]
MKKLFTFLLLLFFLSYIYAWEDCPYGRVNCTYPGKCGLYIDTNHNGICDHSEPEPNTEENTKEENINEVNNGELEIPGSVLKEMTIKEICEKYNIDPKILKEKLGIDVSDNTKFEEIKEKYNIPMREIKNIIAECINESSKKEDEIPVKEDKISNKSESIIDKILSILFSPINLRELIIGWIS